MLYKYHVVLIKDNVIINDTYYKDGKQPTNDDYKKLIERYGADKIVLNKINDDELKSIDKEIIDISKL